VSISKTGAWEGMPTSRTMKLEIRTSTIPAKVLVNGKSIKIKDEKRKSTGKKTTATYDEKWLYVTFIWDGKPVTIDIIDNR